MRSPEGPTHRHRAINVLIVVAAVVAWVAPSALGAPDDPAPLTAADVLDGTCFPAVVLYGQMTDCTFPLTRVAPLDPYLGPHVADIDVTYDDENDEQASCAVADASLVCRNVIAYYTPGERVVRPRISGELASATATFTARDGSDFPRELVAVGPLEPYVFGFSPLRMWAFGTDRDRPGLARVSRRDDPSISWTVNVPAVGSGDADAPVEIDVGGLAPGRYRITPCLGDTAETCQAVPGGAVFQIGTGRLVEVVPGWNRPTADRINVVFAASGDVSLDDALATARELLAWDGPLLVGVDDRPLGPDPSPADVWSVEFGPFAIEPLRSARDRFNIWFLDDLVADPFALAFSALPRGTDEAPPHFGLPDVQVTRLDFLEPGRSRRSESGWASFGSAEGPTAVGRDGLLFAGVYVALPSDAWLLQADTVAHEWGHALFDLRDEYEEPSRGVVHGYPNCAPDPATAQAWWGDRVGMVDPFVTEYMDVMTRWGQWFDPSLVDQITVGMFPGGCYSDRAEDAVRPTADSIMNSGVPVFGAVNRARAEEILGLFSGLAPLGPEVATPSCSESMEVATCTLAVASYVDVAPGLTVTVGSASAGCAAVTGGGPEPGTITCDPLPLDGPGPWDLVFAASDGTRVGEVTVAAPPPTTTTTTTLAPVALAVPAAPAHWAAWLVVAALAMVIGVCTGVLVGRFARRA